MHATQNGMFTVIYCVSTYYLYCLVIGLELAVKTVLICGGDITATGPFSSKVPGPGVVAIGS